MATQIDTTTRRLLEHLHRGGNFAYYWIASEARREKDGKLTNDPAVKRTDWYPAGKPTRLPSDRNGVGPLHLYFGVHPVAAIPSNRTNRKTGEVYVVKPQYTRPWVEEIAAINCLFGEFDTAYTDLPIAPSVVAESSPGKFHCYWLIAEPYILDTEEKRDYAKRLQVAWVRFIGSDEGAKDLARVLRVPGTYNYKATYGPNYPQVRIVTADFDRLYTLSALAAACEAFMESERTDRHRERGEGPAPLTEYEKVEAALQRIGTARWADYSSWLEIGMALHDWDGVHGLSLWDRYSHKFAADKYDTGICEEKWRTFRKSGGGGSLSIASIFHWAQEDSPQERPAPEPRKKGRVVPDAKDQEPQEPEDLWPDHEAPKKQRQPKEDRQATDWRRDGITLRHLQTTAFDPMNWVIEGLLPEGACLLAGKPKSKKSWLALGIAMAVALGGKALGKLDTVRGEVLYLDLESNQRRMKARAQAMLEDRVAWPDNFTIFTKWPRGHECLDQLEDWMTEHPDTRVIVVDILQKIRPPREKNANPYDEDYNAIQPLNAFAERHKITIIVIHHTRKAKADDVFDEISGTTGLSGGTATMWVMGRVPGEVHEMVLHIRGRDVDDEELALKWDDFTCTHVIEGDAALYAQSRERQDVLKVMEPGIQYQPKEIAALLAKSVTNIKFLLRRLLESNLIQKAAYGKYEKVPQVTHSAHSPHSTYSAHSAHSAEVTEPMDDPKSERKPSRVSGQPTTTHSSAAHQDAPKDKSEQSEGLSGGRKKLAPEEIDELLKDNTDTTFSSFGPYVEDDDDATNSD